MTVERLGALALAWLLAGCGSGAPSSSAGSSPAGAAGSSMPTTTGGAPAHGGSSSEAGGSGSGAGGAAAGAAGSSGGLAGAGSDSGGVAGAGAGGTDGADGGVAGQSGTAGGAGSSGESGGLGGLGGAASGGAGGESAGTGGSSAGAAGVAGSSTVDPGTEGDGDTTIRPPFTNAPETVVANGVPRGRVERFQLSSSASVIYPRDVRSNDVFSRAVALYLPNGYVEGTPLPFMVVQDGSSYDDRLIPVLDNLIASNRLPRLAAVFVNPGPGDGPGSQRGLEYDTVSDTYVTFVESELLPRLTADYGVTFTTDPEGRAAFGCSSGGAAAFTMGWFRPDLYRRILTYSGTFTSQARTAEYPDGAWAYHQDLIPNGDRKPLRVFLEVGENDNGANDQGTRNWVRANQGMARALGEKGYHYRFVFAEDAGHCDGRVIAQTLPEAMLWLWRGYLGLLSP